MKEQLSFEDFLRTSRENYLGKEVTEVLRDVPFNLDLARVKYFSLALGDDNPLYTDPEYAAKTRWGCLLANPSIITAIRYPMSHGALFSKDYNLIPIFAGNKMEWFDVIRVGDKIDHSLILTDVSEKQGKTSRLAVLLTEGKFWNQYGYLVAKQYGTCMCPEPPRGAKVRGETVFEEREITKYTDDEVKKILSDIESEVRRGSKPRYWEDVEVGEKLTPVVKGPLTLIDIIVHFVNYFFPNITLPGTFEVLVKTCKENPGLTRYNSILNWPYDHVDNDHFDLDLVRDRGMAAPFDNGVMRVQLPVHLIQNWMGDDGFLRRLESQVRKANLYGDTTWFKGQVMEKYKVSEGRVEYGAVDIKIEGVNQLGVVTTPGSATVYLPSRGREVQVPIPSESD